MNELKKIIGEVFILIIDVFLFAYKIAKEIILPGKRRKGTLLSSLLIFFIGVVERLDGFEHGVFRMANLLRKKYIKQSLLVITFLLFLLSSLEWTKEKAFININTNRTEQVSNNGISKETVGKCVEISSHSEVTSRYSNFPVYKNILQSDAALTPSVKTYLFIRSLRI